MKCLLCNTKVLEEPDLYKLLFRRDVKPHNICGFCQTRFHFISKEHCKYCFQNGDFNENICFDCRNWEIQFDDFLQHTAWYTYNQYMHDFFRSYKRHGDVELAKVFSYQIGENDFFKQFDLITYIPMSKAHQKERQFNPVKELFKELPLENIFEVARDTGAQAMKNRQERLNAPQKFKLIKEIDSSKKILIVDDIYTTGRTLNHARQCILDKYPKAEIETFSLVR
ncbi:competence protein [Companilactobacillus sp. RD055328]|uniref:ComF family protein n=1 Tax=Companilactobacillus sp. RD055328 TaxID=2916634 RepID=UPI001FC8228D|nr:phosphoribosyltransferase family protein [Companilactobacillus sp. RD055328]GKQ43060.1 competence protein [Companilactobacillus sp. RD055328]